MYEKLIHRMKILEYTIKYIREQYYVHKSMYLFYFYFLTKEMIGDNLNTNYFFYKCLPLCF